MVSEIGPDFRANAMYLCTFRAWKCFFSRKAAMYVYISCKLLLSENKNLVYKCIWSLLSWTKSCFLCQACTTCPSVTSCRGGAAAASSFSHINVVTEISSISYINASKAWHPFTPGCLYLAAVCPSLWDSCSFVNKDTWIRDDRGTYILMRKGCHLVEIPPSFPTSFSPGTDPCGAALPQVCWGATSSCLGYPLAILIVCTLT